MKPSQLSRAFAYILSLIGAELLAQCDPASYDDKVDYIGPEKLTRMKLSRRFCAYARRVWGIDLNLAGWIHDRLYAIGGTESFRKFADRIFKSVMIWLIEQCDGWFAEIRQARAFLRAEAYFLLVSEAGPHFFNYRSA